MAYSVIDAEAGAPVGEGLGEGVVLVAGDGAEVAPAAVGVTGEPPPPPPQATSAAHATKRNATSELRMTNSYTVAEMIRADENGDRLVATGILGKIGVTTGAFGVPATETP